MKNNHTRKPKSEHIRCSTDGCINYYNSLYNYVDGLCNPCRHKKRKADNVKDKSK